jgi:hypothetical protein
MTAGLEGAVQHRASRARAGFGERDHFRVRFARTLMESLSHDHTIRRHDDSAHQRIGTGTPGAARGVK